ncbi:MAG: NAD(P)-dependent oxidoreductase [Sulfolobales archaeon]
MKPKVVCCLRFPLHEEAFSMLKNVADTVTLPELPETENVLIKHISDADAVIVTGRIRVTEYVIRNCPKLRIIARWGMGYDNIDVAAATSRGIWVTTTLVVEEAEAVADHVFALILCSARKICEGNNYIKSKKWVRHDIEAYRRLIGVGVWGKTIGIIGLGRIGSLVAERAKGFKMTILYHDIIRKNELEERLGLKYVPLEELLKESDFVIVTVPLTDQTRNLIGKREFSLMKPSAILINTSRGAIVNHEELIEALKDGRIAGAALDVFHKEPLPTNDPILNLDNVILTPHMAGIVSESWKSMSLTVATQVMKALKGEEPPFAVNPEVKRNIKPSAIDLR